MQMQWTDRPVVDNHFSRVGKVTDVVYGDGGNRPEWALVKTGPLSSERLAPLDGAYVSDEGALVLPFDEHTLKHAPKAPRDHVLTPDIASDAIAYFDEA